MKQFEQQHESKHDKLGSEYEALWTNVTIILEELEKHFEDRFYAKVFLSHIFMVLILVTMAQYVAILCFILGGLQKKQNTLK